MSRGASIGRLAGIATVAGLGMVVAATSEMLQRRRRAEGGEVFDRLPRHDAFWTDAAKQEAELVHVVIGDAAASGIGATTPVNAFPTRISRHIELRTGVRVRTVNLARPGARIEDALRDQLPRLQRLSPDFVTIAIGSSDIRDFDPERFERQFKQLVGAMPNGAMVADIPSFLLPPGEQRVKEANRILRAATRRVELPLVSLYDATKRQRARVMFTTADDYFHPNDRGHQLYYSAFVPALEQRIEEVVARIAARIAR